jgi:hypothetical protein
MCRKMRESSESQRVAHEAQILNHSALLHCGEFKEPRLQKSDCPYRKLNLKKKQVKYGSREKRITRVLAP